jgi:hypothetical protein
MAGGNPLYRGGGSIGIIGAARSGLLVARDPDNPDRRVLARQKCNLAKPVPSVAFDFKLTENGVIRIGWIGYSAHTAQSLLAAPQSDEDRGSLNDAIQVLRSILVAGSMPVKDIRRDARKAGVADRTLDRAKAALGVQSVRLGFGPDAEWRWELPKSASG